MDATDLLRNSLLQLSKSERVRDVIEQAPVEMVATKLVTALIKMKSAA